MVGTGRQHGGQSGGRRQNAGMKPAQEPSGFTKKVLADLTPVQAGQSLLAIISGQILMLSNTSDKVDNAIRESIGGGLMEMLKEVQKIRRRGKRGVTSRDRELALWVLMVEAVLQLGDKARSLDFPTTTGQSDEEQRAAWLRHYHPERFEAILGEGRPKRLRQTAIRWVAGQFGTSEYSVRNAVRLLGRTPQEPESYLGEGTEYLFNRDRTLPVKTCMMALGYERGAVEAVVTLLEGMEGDLRKAGEVAFAVQYVPGGNPSLRPGPKPSKPT